MNKSVKITLVVVLPLLLAMAMVVLLYFGTQREDKSLLPSPLIGKAVPSFSATSLVNQRATLTESNLTGKIRLLNVWASWCSACRLEHDILLGLQGAGVDIVGLNYKDQAQDGLKWLAEMGNPYSEIIFDEQGKIGIDFGVYGVPETFVLDENGIIQGKHVGPLTVEVVQQKLLPTLKALKQTKPTAARANNG